MRRRLLVMVGAAVVCAVGAGAFAVARPGPGRVDAPVRGCPPAGVDCVEPDARVVPAAAMMSVEEVEGLYGVDAHVSGNGRAEGPLSLCPGDGDPATRIGSAASRGRGFAAAEELFSEVVWRLPDAASAADAARRLAATTAACTTTRRDGPAFRQYARRPAPAGLDGTWFTEKGPTGDTATHTVWVRGRDVLMLTAATERLLLLAMDGALRRVEAPPPGPVCDLAGCDSGDQHPQGLPPQVTNGQNDDRLWAVLLRNGKDTYALNDRGYREDRRALLCWQGAAAALDRDDDDEATAVLVADEAAAKRLAAVLEPVRTEIAHVTLRCLA